MRYQHLIDNRSIEVLSPEEVVPFGILDGQDAFVILHQSYVKRPPTEVKDQPRTFLAAITQTVGGSCCHRLLQEIYLMEACQLSSTLGGIVLRGGELSRYGDDDRLKRLILDIAT